MTAFQRALCIFRFFQQSNVLNTISLPALSECIGLLG